MTTSDVLLLPALSVRQPWTDWILWGWKPCENRTWDTTYRGPVTIHAGKTRDRLAPMVVQRLARIGVDTTTTPRGVFATGYLGVVDLLSTHPAEECPGGCGIWGEDAPGVVHWVVANPRRFATPMPGGGWLGLYRRQVPDEVQTAGRVLVAA